MKKKTVNPLDLDKETIAKLNEDQLDAIQGGASDPDDADETNCNISCNLGTSCNANLEVQ
jgi:hypothetical protein